MEEEEDVKSMRGVLAILLLIAAIIVSSIPLIQRKRLDSETTRVVDMFLSEPAISDVSYPELFEAMLAYNENLVGEQRQLLSDPWSYEQVSFDLTEYGIEDDVFGILEIPSISLSMPVYLGASKENMAKGAAHLSNTSLPIGGTDTNSVIAGHRGYSGSDYFRYLDRLAVGDEVELTNLWETLRYQVVEIKIIEPSDIKQIFIQQGRELLTLLTCHPYASGGRQRLVIYCERIPNTSP